MHCWWECKLVQPLWQTVEVLPTAKNSPLCDSAVLLLVIYPKEMKSVSLRDLWASKLVVALSILAKT